MDRHTTTRFSNREADYARYRPGYPSGLRDALEGELGLSAGSVVADIGSGTGISTQLLLDLGCTVHAVEPNADMRGVAEQRFRGEPRFHSVAATAEQTTLASASVDAVTAGQAFHWFAVDDARREWVRILKSGGRAALFWNSRRTDETPFLRDYEQVFREYGLDYPEVKNEWTIAGRLASFFADGGQTRVFHHEQRFDLEGLLGLARSASYTPPPGHPRHAPMMQALARLFDTHQDDGRVRMVYDTRLYYGRLHA